MTQKQSLVQLIDIHKRYGHGEAAFYALQGVNFQIEEGDFVAVMGPSGSGKSTCMNIVGALDTPTSGQYLYRGVHVELMTQNERALLRRKYFGFIFQGFNLLPRTTALENVELPLLDRVGLLRWENHTPGELSGGQQQRVAIARAIVSRPELLLADEPTGSLDTKRSIEIMQLLKDLNEQDGITVALVTHEPDMAQFAKRIVHFRDGNIELSQGAGHVG